MKRTLDLIAAFLLLIILSPVLLIISFIILLSSKGPVLFKQRRIGRGKSEFFIYKFRTMYVEAPKDVPTHLLDDPNRFITPIGKFLRKTSLDELPQLVNILIGDMSFVGPRPALYNQHDLIELRDKYNVNSIRPGLTGWAQVNGRDELPIPKKVEYDKYYLERQSILLDAAIIMKTFSNVLMAEGIVEGKQISEETKMVTKVERMKKLVIRSLAFVAADIVTINIGLFLAFFLRFDFSMDSIPQNFLVNIPILALIATVIKLAIFTAFRLYKSLWRYAGIYEVINVVIASGVANAVLSVVLVMQHALTGTIFAPRSLFAITFMIDIFAIGGVRILYKAFRHRTFDIAADTDKLRRVLIVGAGESGAIMAREMRTHPELHLRPVAFVDNDTFKIGFKINGIPVSGYLGEIADIAEKKQVNEIIIALPHAKPAELNKVYAECAKTDCRIRILPSMTQIIDESVVMQKVKDVDIEDLLGRDMVTLDNEAIAGYIENQPILVTGAGGSIGSELSRQIARFGPKTLILLDNYENNLHDVVLELKSQYPGLDIKPVIATIREEKRIDEVFSLYKPVIVFHAAAHKHVPLMEWHPEEAVKNNIIGTWNVAHSAHKFGAKRFVLISSDKAVNPTNIMGATKRVAEMIIQALDTISDTEFMAVRFGNVLGSNGSVIPLFRKQIEAGGPVTVTHPEMTRYFMAIPEAAQLVVQAGAIAKGGEIFILDMGQPVKILELAENMIRLSGFEPYEDIEIKFIGLRPGEKLYEELLLSEEGIQKTKNDKIFVAEPFFSDYERICEEIGKLKSHLDNFEGSGIKDYISKLVPTYSESQDDVL